MPCRHLYTGMRNANTLSEIHGFQLEIPAGMRAWSQNARKLHRPAAMRESASYEIADERGPFHTPRVMMHISTPPRSWEIECAASREPLRRTPSPRTSALHDTAPSVRGHHRIQAELILLQRTFGADAVDWTPDQQWITLHAYPLPEDYNQPASDLLIHVPEEYGRGTTISACYLDTGLRYLDRRSRRWVKIPNYFDAGDAGHPYAGFSQGERGYFSLPGIEWGPRASFLTFLDSVFTALSAPFASLSASM